MLIKDKTIWTPDNSYLLKYKAEIECGNIIVGQELWQQIDNLYEQLMYDERFYYDTTDAKIRISFFENCVLGTKSPYYGKKVDWLLWELAFIEAFYSFKLIDGTDRFHKALLLVSRKNGKSAIATGLCLGEFYIGPAGADIVCSSNDDNQASIVYNGIDENRRVIDPQDLDSKRNQTCISNKNNNSKIFKISDRQRNKDGRNIDFAIIDEVHEMKTNDVAAAIEQSQSTKINPKIVLITTEGVINDGYLDDELKKCRKIINNEDDDIRLLPWLYTQDSESEVWDGNRENKLWMKSNPSLGVAKRWEYTEDKVEVARKYKSDRITVLCKDFNIKQNSVQSWLNLEDYTYKNNFDINDFKGYPALGAVDLAETTDLCCAKIIMMKPNDERIYCYSHYFICEGKLNNPDTDDHNAGAKYKEWAQKGYMTICSGNEVDLSQVADWFYKLYTDLNIKVWKCGYDQRFSKEFLTRMDHYGWVKDKDVEMVLQNADTLNNALKYLELDLQHQKVHYNDNPIDRWCFENAGIKVDSKGLSLCVKQRSDKKIDGTVTLIIAYEMFRRHKTEFKQLVKQTVH